MFASHRDAAIFGYYATKLNDLLESFYKDAGISPNVLAYRRLGRGNGSFSAEAHGFASANSPCMILAFDVKDFFGSLDHKILKTQLKKILNVDELPKDWYQVYKAVTRYHFIDREDLEKDLLIGPRFKERSSLPIATISEIKAQGIKIHPSSSVTSGIPQGTPISAVLSNLYMVPFDVKMAELAESKRAYYRRYSDDILIICGADDADEFSSAVATMMLIQGLKLNHEKTEKVNFDLSSHGDSRVAQYLGFSLSPAGATLRPGTVSRRWRKLKGALRGARKAAERAVAKGRPISTRKLYRQFTPVGPRNFSTYARTAAKSFQDQKKLLRQIRRMEMKAAIEIKKFKKESVAPKDT